MVRSYESNIAAKLPPLEEVSEDYSKVDELRKWLKSMDADDYMVRDEYSRLLSIVAPASATMEERKQLAPKLDMLLGRFIRANEIEDVVEVNTNALAAYVAAEMKRPQASREK